MPCLLRAQENENVLVSSCGDGSIKVWDVAAPASANPLRSYQEHSREASPRTPGAWGLLCRQSALSSENKKALFTVNALQTKKMLRSLCVRVWPCMPGLGSVLQEAI